MATTNIPLHQFKLSHLSDQGISQPLVLKGVPWNHPLRKPLSSWNFVKNTTLYIYKLKQPYSSKKYAPPPKKKVS